MKLIFLGAPGAGKGTQAEAICKALNIPAISTGNILKAAMKNETPLGLKAKSYIEGGQLVPDDVIIDIVKARIQEDDCKDGFLFDGFPRTIAQAEALDKMGVSIDRVINIRVTDDMIVRRISGRRSCAACGAVYHIENKKPKCDNICDNCGEKLVIRSDDEPQTVQKRLEVYHTQTKPLERYYADKGLLSEVDGEKDTALVTKDILEVLGK
ncbi:MAG TPA: adenylate kinase [Oscillospiraceae bacterium]|mgnify:CR=1 FL=1|nr:adenylate kinase [Oscillospiraceae bacterium]HPF56665.1 adenylate kinase [Clostridiales bacterium]HPK35047.1 adenylate kinase [Oscillospiraceae bacterium]HPR76684.1 adenylate kinase [Oscillospiraceae bacterium]